VGKRIAIAAAVIVVLCIGGGAWLWHQVFALPDWYTEGDAVALELQADPAAPPQWVALDENDEPLPVEDAAVEKQLDEAIAPPQVESPSPAEAAPAPTVRRKPRKNAKAHELRGFHRHAARGKAGETAVKASRARYEDGRLEAGVIADLSKIPRERLTAKDRALYERAVDNFPGLTKRDVYVGIEDTPVERDGFLQLGDAPKIRVGNLRYSLSSAAAKLGFTPERLRRELDLELRRMGMRAPE
jgi:hypothetical protein